MSLPISRLWFVLATALVSLALFGAARVVWKSHARWRWVSLVFGISMTFVTALASINSYFEYFPTLGSLFGKDKDVAPLSSVRDRLGAAPPSAAIPLPAHGKVVAITIPGTNSHFKARAAEVYLPPRWFVDGTPPLPVVELLHGTPGTPEDWIRGGGVQDDADTWAASHDGYAPIFVMADPNGSVLNDTECINGKLGNAETYLTQDVRNYALTQLRASTTASNWAIGGLSEGGYCGAMLALRHPDLYSVFLDFGGEEAPSHTGGMGALLAGTTAQIASDAKQYNLRELIKSHDPNASLAGWFVAGGDDAHVARLNKELADLSKAYGIDAHSLVVPHGHHTFGTWKLSWPAHSTSLRTTSAPPNQQPDKSDSASIPLDQANRFDDTTHLRVKSPEQNHCRFGGQ